jgi:CBS domain-containing protein
MSTVRDMIHQKGGEIYSISPEASVLEALKLMAEHNTGALLVRKGDEVEGVLSERDCVRKVELEGRTAAGTKVNEIMTRKVVTVEAGQELEDCMTLMIEKNIRHLPVYENEKLLGLISVRDVLREVVEVQKSLIAQLELYITGRVR